MPGTETVGGETTRREARGRLRLVALPDRVVSGPGLTTPERRVLALAAEPELLDAYGAEPEPTGAVWLRGVAGPDGPLLAAIHAFDTDEGPAAAIVAAPVAQIPRSAGVLALVRTAAQAAEDPERWALRNEEGVDLDGAPAVGARASTSDSQALAVSLLNMARSGPRPGVAPGWSDRAFWAGAAALFDALPEAWRPFLSLAHGFVTPPAPALAAGRAGAAGRGPEELLGGNPAALDQLSTLGPAPLLAAFDQSDAADMFRRRLTAVDPAGATRRNDAVAAFLLDFEAPPPPPPTGARGHAEQLAVLLGALHDQSLAGKPLGRAGAARALGLAAYDVSPAAMTAWATTLERQPSLAPWAALLVERASPDGPLEGRDRILGLEALARLTGLESALAATMEPGVATPFDSPAFEERLAEFAQGGAVALALAPQALISRVGAGRDGAPSLGPSPWIARHGPIFRSIDADAREALAVQAAAVSAATAFGVQGVWKKALDQLRDRADLTPARLDLPDVGVQFLTAFAAATSSGAARAAAFWRLALDLWTRAAGAALDDPAEFLRLAAEKFGAGPGAAAARRAASMAGSSGAAPTSAAAARPAAAMPVEPPPAPPEAADAPPAPAGGAAAAAIRAATLAAQARAAEVAAPTERAETPPPARLKPAPPMKPAPSAAPAPGAAPKPDPAPRSAPPPRVRPETPPEPEADDSAAPPPPPRSEPAPPPRRLSAEGLSRLKEEIPGYGVERAAEREVARQRAPSLLAQQDAAVALARWRDVFRGAVERAMDEPRPRAWSLLDGVGSPDAVRHEIDLLSQAMTALGKQAEKQLLPEVVWAARHFDELAIEAKARPRAEPAPASIRRGWDALAAARADEAPVDAGLFGFAMASEWLTLARAPLVRPFLLTLGGQKGDFSLEDGRMVSLPGRALAGHIYGDESADGFARLDRSSLFARLDRLMFFLTLFDWRDVAQVRALGRTQGDLWKPAPVGDLLGARAESDHERKRHVALSALEPPEAFVDRLRAEIQAAGDAGQQADAQRIARTFCAIADRTGLPKVGQLGRIEGEFQRALSRL